MQNIIDAVRMADRIYDIKKTAKFIYGDQWPAKRAEALEVINAYKTKNNCSSVLTAAIAMCKLDMDARVIVVLMAAAADVNTENDGEPA